MLFLKWPPAYIITQDMSQTVKPILNGGRVGREPSVSLSLITAISVNLSGKFHGNLPTYPNLPALKWWAVVDFWGALKMDNMMGLR